MLPHNQGLLESGGQTQLQGWNSDLFIHPRPSLPPPPTPNVFFLDLLHSTSLPPLTSGQNPCIWFSVTIILVMMTKTEVPLVGEGREKSAPGPIYEVGTALIPILQMGKLRCGVRDLAKVTGLTKGRGGSKSGPTYPPSLSCSSVFCVDHRPEEDPAVLMPSAACWRAPHPPPQHLPAAGEGVL